ncbi:phenylalanine--tRNA ligase subunit beta [Acetobacter orientalis]|uniref:Phenylalanine--tRNA ligase subunit beta n=1 Tax=Acetobacter orientalis TaxID=146474 RepID=A0A2Z5ZGY3_9PROT|nr:phenylalanine--tRNA ligase subunit beta [Acetobacter orientalis]
MVKCIAAMHAKGQTPNLHAPDALPAYLARFFSPQPLPYKG